MLKTIVANNKPEILVITPLYTGHKVSKETKKTIKRTKTPYTWITYMGKNNPCKNTQIAFDMYRRNNDLPKYVIKIDNDIIAQRGMIDIMYDTLERSMTHEVYAYCTFEFQGSIKAKFPAIKFDKERLQKSNYISSCSLIKVNKFLEVGMWVTDDKGFRLLDWALWLKFLNRGYVGIPTNKETSFIAIASENSVSARDSNDYHEKHKWVVDNFISS